MRVRSDDVIWREVAGEAIILDLRSSTYLTTNKTGARMWQLLQADRSSAELADDLMATYGITEQAAQQDVASFLAMLRENDLLGE